MSNSFFFLQHGDGAPCVKVLHINLWHLSPSDTLFEVGAWFEIDVKNVSTAPMEFRCITPAPIRDNNVENLFDQLIDANYSHLLLDAKHHLHTYGTQGGQFHVVELPRGNYFVLPVEIFTDSPHELKLSIDARNIPNDVLLKYASKSGNGPTRVGFYVRFRYRVDSGVTCAMLVRNKGLVHHGLLFDFRANEARSIHDSGEIMNILPIVQLLFFLVQPISYRVVLDGKVSCRRYVRLLESQWLDYIGYRGSERFIVYSWTLEGTSSYHLLVESEREKPDHQPIFIGTIIFLFSIVILSVNAERIGLLVPDWKASLEVFATWVNRYIPWIYATITGLSSYLIGHIIWDTFLHTIWSRIWRLLSGKPQ